jgi:WD40 repeat protein/DNA-binding SARP family transcriptional activator
MRRSLSLLGSFHATIDDKPVTFPTDRARALLAYLAVERDRPHRREALAALFWPDKPESTGRVNLRQALARVRRAIGDLQAPTPALLVSNTAIQFNKESELWVDAISFLALLDACRTHPHRRLDACRNCTERLEQAIELYKGDFLTGLTLSDSNAFEEWRLFKQEELHTQALDALNHLAIYYERRRDYERATRYLQRQIELESWREEAHARLMRVLALKGDRTAALNQYDLCRRTLAEELGVEPSPATVQLYERIRDDKIQPERIEVDNPYKGLQAFQELDAADFYGRDVFIERLVQAINQQPLVTVLGPSGSGKSSLIFAGLLPRLSTPLELTAAHPAQTGADPKHRRPPGPDDSQHRTQWFVAAFRPGARPFYQLAVALAPLLAPPVNVDELARKLKQDVCSLGELIEPALQTRRDGGALTDTVSGRNDHKMLLIIDQFEELYTLCQDEETRREFLNLLLRSVGDGPNASRCIVLLPSMRADFVGQALAYRPLADAIQQGGLILGPMNDRELQQAIEEPARSRGVIFEPGLVERILNDVSNSPGSLPLLEFALTLLWQRQEDGKLTHAAYEEIGQIAGALTSYADKVYEALSDEDQARTRRIFLQLVQPGQGTEDTRRVVTRGELGETNWQLVRKLADARLLITDRSPSGQDTAEVAHEALIRSWTRLRGWLDEDRTFRTWQHRLRSALEQWEATNFDDGALLRGAPLAEAEAWAAERREDLSPQEQAFIDKSLALSEKERRDAEAQQARELAQAQALAELERQKAEAEQRRADTAARARQRLLWLTIGLGVMLVLVAITTAQAFRSGRQARLQAEAAVTAQAAAQAERSVAESERQRAEAAARRALSRQLAAQAINNLDEKLDLAILLSLESLRLSDSPSDRTDLLTELTFTPFASQFLHEHTGPIHYLAYGPGPQGLVSGGSAGPFFTWDLSTKKIVKKLPLELREGTVLTLSPDGRWLAVGQDATIDIWDVESGQLSYPSLGSRTENVNYMAFSENGGKLVVGDKGGNVVVWDVATGQRDMIFTGAGKSAVVAVSPKADKVAFGGKVNKKLAIFIGDVETGELVEEPSLGHTANIHQMRFSPDGSMLASASFDGSVRLWDTQTGRLVFEPLLGHDGRVLSVAFSPDGRILASGGTDNAIFLWDTTTGAQIGAPFIGHSNWIRELVFSPDGKTLVSADADGNIILWDMSLRQILRGHTDRVRSVALSPDGRTLITGSFDGAIVRWDTATGQPLGPPLTEQERTIIQVAYSPRGDTFASSDAGGGIILWDANTGRPRFPKLTAHEDVVIGLAFSPDGEILASGDFSGNINLWDVATGKPIHSPIQAHDGWALSLAFGPDGRLLASGGTDGIIRLWQVTRRNAGEPVDVKEVVEPVAAHSNWVTSLAFDTQGKTLVSSSSDGAIGIWNPMTLEPVGRPLTGHKTQVWSVAFDHGDEDRTIVSLGGEGSVIRWDLASREPLGPPLITGGESESMALSPDGRTLYLGSFDETASIWRLDKRPWPERACQLANRNLTEDEWRQHLATEPYAKTCPDLP